MKIHYSCQSAMKQLGVEKLRDYQIKPINRILNGKDTMVIAPTSAGKSLIYQLPALVHNEKLTLVIEPTLSLMHDSFLCGHTHIMVATTAFGMGVDQSDVDLVIHFNMPISIIDYYQQAGRAGRQGQQAHCVLLYSDDDYFVDKAILESIEHFSARQRALSRLDSMRDFCQDTKHCMVKALLSELGEQHAKNCNHCTNCQKARRHK